MALYSFREPLQLPCTLLNPPRIVTCVSIASHRHLMLLNSHLIGGRQNIYANKGGQVEEQLVNGRVTGGGGFDLICVFH